MAGENRTLAARMVVTMGLLVAFAVSFVFALAFLYGRLVPAMLAWWAASFEQSSDLTVVVVLCFGLGIVYGAYGFVTNLHLSPRGETNAQATSRADYPALYAAVDRLATQADVPTPSIEVVPSSVPNAYTTGFTQRRSTLVVSEGLLETLTDDERDAVLAHELAHVKNRDCAIMRFAYVVPAVTLAFAMAIVWPISSQQRPSAPVPGSDPEGDAAMTADETISRYRSRSATSRRRRSTGGVWYAGGSSRHADSSDSDDDDLAGLVIAFVALLGILLVTAFLTFALSVLFWAFTALVIVALARARELAADRGAAAITGDPAALASALRTIDDSMDDLPARDMREMEGAVEALYVAPLRSGAFDARWRGITEIGWLSVLSADAFPTTHPPTAKRIERLRAIADEVHA